MPKDLALDTVTHDLVLSSFDAALVDDLARVAQQVKITLLLFMGEWFLDLTFGVPYYRDILIKNPNRAVVEGLFRSAILAVPNVTEIASLVLEYDSIPRRLSVAFEAFTDFGALDFNDTLEI